MTSIPNYGAKLVEIVIGKELPPNGISKIGENPTLILPSLVTLTFDFLREV